MTDEPFGALLRRLRKQAEWRQLDLADHLGLGRSTIANLESGRERPGATVWQAIQERLPDWAHELERAYGEARRAPVNAPTKASKRDQPFVPFKGGPFTIESVKYVYLFEESRSPGEILEVRRVRAAEQGADCYGLLLTHTGSTGFQVDQQALWGGSLHDSTHETEEGRTLLWRRFDFDRRLRIGQRHEFALRTWVEQDPDPQTNIGFDLSIPAREVSIHLGFHGSVRPKRAWAYGPLTDAEADDPPAEGRKKLRVAPDGSVVARFRKPEVGPTYGLVWEWA